MLNKRFEVERKDNETWYVKDTDLNQSVCKAKYSKNAIGLANCLESIAIGKLTVDTVNIEQKHEYSYTLFVNDKRVSHFTQYYECDLAEKYIKKIAESILLRKTEPVEDTEIVFAIGEGDGFSIRISNELLGYLQTISVNGEFNPKLIGTESEWVESKYSEPFEIIRKIYDTQYVEKIKEIRDRTQHLGDHIIAENITETSSWNWEFTSFDFCYTKKVIKVEGGQCFMLSNRNKLFSVPINDYLMMNDEIAKGYTVEVTKFHDGKSFVTRIVERPKRHEIEHLKKVLATIEDVKSPEYKEREVRLHQLEEELAEDIAQQRKSLMDLYDY